MDEYSSSSEETRMRLHVGSGPHYAIGWVNLDLNEFDGWEIQPDVQASVFDMPFKDNTVDKLYVGHLLEHLKWELVPDAVREMARVLRPTGTICVVGPCMDKALATGQPQWLLDEIPAGWNSDVNNPDGLEGFPHLWTATTDLTREALELGGLSNIREVSIVDVHLPEWPNTAPGIPPLSGMWQCAFLANK